MKDFDSLVGIWNNQKTAPKVDFEEIIAQYKTSRNKLSSKIYGEAFLMAIAIVVIVLLAIKVEFNLWTSLVGLVIIFACGIYFITIQLVNIKRIADSNTLFDKPRDHISFIKKFRAQRYTQHTKNYRLYSIALSIGTGLFLIEMAYKMGVVYVGIIAVLTLAWFAVYYFYFLKKYIRNEDQKFEEMILDLERLDEQFRDEG